MAIAPLVEARPPVMAHVSRNAPIGIFDSGLGGLSVYREIRAMLPAEDVLYLADSAWCPYGVRPPDEIRERSLAISGHLIKQGAKIVVVACNTASAMAIESLRAAYPGTRFIGLEPAVKPAVAMTMTGRVGVLATPRTVEGDRLRMLIEHWSDGVTVNTIAGNGMVELVEDGLLEGDAVDAVIGPLLDPLMAEGADMLVLGCTHYPFLRGAIQTYVGPDVRIIDSGHAIARRTLSLLQEQRLLHERGEIGSFVMETTGVAEQASRVTSQLLGRSISAVHLDL